MFYLRTILGCLAVLILAGCQSAPKPCCQKLAATSASMTGMPQYSTNSLYDLNITWQDDSGHDFNLSQLRGQPVVISMFFATCEGVCVITKDDMKTVESSLPANLRQHTAFVFVTLEPARDTAENLHAYRTTQGLSPDRWRLLRGSVADTARLAAFLGIGYGYDKSGLFRHSSQVIVLDHSGKIALWQNGVHADLAETAKFWPPCSKTPSSIVVISCLLSVFYIFINDY